MDRCRRAHSQSSRTAYAGVATSSVLGGRAHSQSSRTADAGVAMLSVSMEWAKASSEPAPWRHNLGGLSLERHVIHPCPGSSRSSLLTLWVEPGQAGAACAKRGKRRVLFAAPGLWLLPSHAPHHVAPAIPTFSVHRPASTCLCPWVPCRCRY